MTRGRRYRGAPRHPQSRSRHATLAVQSTQDCPSDRTCFLRGGPRPPASWPTSFYLRNPQFGLVPLYVDVYVCRRTWDVSVAHRCLPRQRVPNKESAYSPTLPADRGCHSDLGELRPRPVWALSRPRLLPRGALWRAVLRANSITHKGLILDEKNNRAAFLRVAARGWHCHRFSSSCLCHRFVRWSSQLDLYLRRRRQLHL
jgi:hypothetical protein